MHRLTDRHIYTHAPYLTLKCILDGELVTDAELAMKNSFNLERDVRSWSDYLKSYVHGRSLVQTKGVNENTPVFPPHASLLWHETTEKVRSCD